MCWCDPNKRTPNCGRAGCASPQEIARLRADLAASQAECERLRVVLAKARDTFARYAKQHWAKGTLESDEKARVNDTLVAEINAVLAAKKGGE